MMGPYSDGDRVVWPQTQFTRCSIPLRTVRVSVSVLACQHHSHRLSHGAGAQDSSGIKSDSGEESNSPPSAADRNIVRKDPDWPGLGPMSIPGPITAARGVGYQDWPALGHMLTSMVRGWRWFQEKGRERPLETQSSDAL